MSRPTVKILASGSYHLLVGRVVAVAGGRVHVEFDGGERAWFRGDQVDAAQRWHEDRVEVGRLVVLRRGYPEFGVGVGQLARVLEIDLYRQAAKVETPGCAGRVRGWVSLDEVHPAS